VDPSLKEEIRAQGKTTAKRKDLNLDQGLLLLAACPLHKPPSNQNSKGQEKMSEGALTKRG
jgi:hypothetical protein